MHSDRIERRSLAAIRAAETHDLTGAQQPALRGKSLDAVLASDRHTQTHRHALQLNPAGVPLTQVYDHREIQYREKCENECVCIHVSI